jgi:hypothetical protein
MLDGSPIGAISDTTSEGRLDFEAAITSPGQLALGSSATGRWRGASDRDWFRVSLEADQSYQFSLGSSKGLAPNLLLRNSTGDVVAEGVRRSARKSSLTLTTDDPGLFYLDAGTSRRGRSTYRLQATAVENDPLTVATTSGPGFRPPRSNVDSITGLIDQDIRDWVNYSLTDNLLNKTELRQILSAAGTDDGVVDATELKDLRTLSAALSIYLDPTKASYLQDIYTNVVTSHPANAWWTAGTSSRTALGDLSAGSTNLTLERLLAKWFDGSDLPLNRIGDMSFGYRRASGALFVNDVTLSDVSQGAAGTCYLLAAAQVIAKSTPQLIQQMFCDNGDGTYGVRFYGQDGGNFWVTVDSRVPMPASGSPGGELWVSLLEKAYAQANETGLLGRDLAINSYEDVQGGSFDTLMHLSGAAVTAFSAYYAVPGSQWTDNLPGWQNVETAAREALNRGTSLWLGSYGSTTGSNGKANLVYAHAFSISSYNSSTGLYVVNNASGAAGGNTWNGSFAASWADLFSVQGVVAWV